MIEDIRSSARSIAGFVREIFSDFVVDDCPSTAAALTYQTLFAVVPLLTVTYAMFNAFEVLDGVGNRLEEFLFNNIVPENVTVVQEYLASFSDQARNLSGPSTILLAVTAFLMLFTIERTFNEIWRVREPRRGFQRFLMYWAILTLGPILIGLGFVISTYIVSLPLISNVTASTGMLKFLPFLLSVCLFTMIYVAVPNCVVRLRDAIVGGVLVAAAFELAKVLFATIMAKSNFEVIYGTFAAVPLFLLWIYLSWTIVLIGAQLVKELAVYRFDGNQYVESPMIQLLLILELFYEAHLKGDVVKEGDIRQLADRVDVSDWNDYKATLMDLNLIRSVDRGGLVLCRDLKEVSVWDLYRHVPFDMPETIGGEKSWEHNLASRLSKISGQGMEYLKMDLETLFNLDEPEDVAVPTAEDGRSLKEVGS